MVLRLNYNHISNEYFFNFQFKKMSQVLARIPFLCSLKLQAVRFLFQLLQSNSIDRVEDKGWVDAVRSLWSYLEGNVIMADTSFYKGHLWRMRFVVDVSDARNHRLRWNLWIQITGLVWVFSFSVATEFDCGGAIERMNDTDLMIYLLSSHENWMFRIMKTKYGTNEQKRKLKFRKKISPLEKRECVFSLSKLLMIFGRSRFRFGARCGQHCPKLCPSVHRSSRRRRTIK